MYARDVNPDRHQVLDPVVGDWLSVNSKIVGLAQTRLEFADHTAVYLPHDEDLDTRPIPED